MTNPPTTQHLAGGPAAPLPSPLPPRAGAVTILTAASGKRATKIHRRDGQGGWQTLGYDKLFEFSGRTERAETLFDFMAVLTNAARNPGSIVVAEAIRGEANPANMRRLAYDDKKTGDLATLCPHPEGVRWICWEVDHIAALPDWFNPNDLRARDRDTDLAEWWIKTHLPECFHNRSAILQWSASALVGGKVSFHLWQWTDRPVSRASVKAYARAHWKGRMDVSVWDSARVHYIAAPIFEAVDGSKMEDALGPWRWQWVKGESDECEAPPEWVDQPTWEQHLRDAKAEGERLRAEFMAARAVSASSKSGGGGEDVASGDETGAITSADLLPLRDLDPKRVLAWAAKIGTRCADQIRAAVKGGPDGRHPTARSYSLFFGNVLEGLDRMGAALSEDTRKRVNWFSEVAAVESAVFEMESAAIAVGDSDPDRARVVRWAVEMGRLGEAILPDYRLKEKYRESAKQGGKVIPMKKRAGLPAYEDQPAVSLARVDGDGVVVDEDDEVGSHAPPAGRQSDRGGVCGGFDDQPKEMDLALRYLDDVESEAGHEIVFDEGALWRYTDAKIWHLIKQSELTRHLSAWHKERIFLPDGKPKKKEGKDELVEITKAKCLAAYWMSGQIRDQEGFFGDARMGVVTSDGVFVCANLRAGQIETEPAGPNTRARAALPCAYDPEAKGELLDHYLKTVHEGHPDADDRVRLMGELAFAALTGLGPRLNKAVLCYGTQGTGKSVFLEILSGLIPQEAQVSIQPHQIANEYYGAELVGKLLNIVTECKEADVMSEAGFKAVVSGETITCRHIRGEPIKFRPRALHVFAGNKLPAAPGASDAFWIRWVVLGFDRTFRETDKEIKELGARIVAEELGAVFAWAMRCGADLLKRRRYTVPASTETLFKVWKKDSDSVAAWLDESCDILPPETERRLFWRAGDAYKNYKGWCEENGNRPTNSTNFRQRLEQAGVMCTRVSVNLYGIKIKAEVVDTSDDGLPDEAGWRIRNAYAKPAR